MNKDNVIAGHLMIGQWMDFCKIYNKDHSTSLEYIPDISSAMSRENKIY